jgi:hypothetical protein
MKVLLIVFLFSFSKSWGQTIAIQDFETSPAAPTWPICVGSTFTSSATGGADTPANQRIRNGSKSFQINNTTRTLELCAFTLSSCASVQAIVYISSTSVSSGNGADAADNLKVFANVNGAGYPATADITVVGATNARWGYNTTGVTTNAGTPVSVAGTTGTNAGTIYSKLIINIPNGSTSVALKIIAVNDDANEIWNVDDVQLIGTCTSCAAPTLTITPTTQTICAGTTTTIGITSSAASPNYTWQASANGSTGWTAVASNTPVGTSYTGQGTATLSVTAGSTYYYQCLVTDGASTCVATSSTSTLVVNTLPSITTPTISSATSCEGSSNVTVKINASGSSSLSYQWQVSSGSGFANVSGVAYTGGTTNTLSIGNSITAGTYSFQCIVTNACGSATSSVSSHTVVAIPTAPPTPSLITSCNPAVISETVVGTPPAGVTWYWASNAAAPVSYTSSVTDYSATSSGTVFIRAKSDVGTCWNTTGTTNSVVVTVIKSPTITTQPTSSLVCQGTTASFKVTMSASSSTVLTYQWQENTGSGFANISSGSPYTISLGTHTSTLDIDGTKPIGTYTYQCIISNSCGTVTTSIINVTVTATPANDLCSNASSIVIDAPPITGNLNCASPTPGLTYAPTKNDVWYVFTPTCTATHTVTMNFTTSGADYDLDVFATGSCPASGSATYTSHGTSSIETISQTFLSGVTYYVRVIDYNTNGGTFSIGIVSNCGTPHTVTFDLNGGLGSMGNQTASASTNLTANAFTNSGCTFVTWNDSANANGTSYANTAVYSFTADVTLYAQWNCASGGGSAGCPYLVSAVVNACAGSCGAEGKNEIVVMNSGSYAIPVNGSNINLYYSGGTNHYFTNSFAASSGTVITNLNTLTATGGCTNTPFVFVPSGGTIPANSNFMILNNSSCFNGNFSAYCNSGPIYVIISTDADWYFGGYFGNNSTPRYFRTDFSNLNSGCGLTTYNYNNPSTFAFSSDGASVLFNGSASPTYINGTGTCAPSIFILPIELIDFYATQNGSKNDLIWKVASEKNVTQYIIENSEDGVNFKEMTRLNSLIREGEVITYMTEDEDPFSGITYYRLSTLENNGIINRHKIIDIDRGNKDWKSLLYQNDDELILEFKNTIPENAQITLFDLSGKPLVEKGIEQSQTKINTAKLSVGLYFAKITTPYKTENFKIIIQ